jgi:hypothetical protein
MKLLSVEPSDKPKYKYVATFETDRRLDRFRNKKVYFGASGYKDFTILSQELPKAEAEEKRLSYQARHLRDLETKDPSRAGYLSYFLLWNKPTLEASIRDYKRMFNL